MTEALRGEYSGAVATIETPDDFRIGGTYFGSPNPLVGEEIVIACLPPSSTSRKSLRGDCDGFVHTTHRMFRRVVLPSGAEIAVDDRFVAMSSEVNPRRTFGFLGSTAHVEASTSSGAPKSCTAPHPWSSADLPPDCLGQVVPWSAFVAQLKLVLDGSISPLDPQNSQALRLRGVGEDP